MAFEISLWSSGAIRLLVVCEEAHRYVPADPLLGFFPTRQAISRIAKEGRKYGVSLGVITQRPGELDPTILSQCSTVFAMRLANDHDQEIIRSAIPDSSSSTISFLSSIGNGEAIAFGEAVAVPMRMVFERVRAEVLPRANSGLAPTVSGDASGVDLKAIVQRMRHINPNEQPYSATTPAGHDEIGAAPALDPYAAEPARTAGPSGDLRAHSSAYDELPARQPAVPMEPRPGYRQDGRSDHRSEHNRPEPPRFGHHSDDSRRAEASSIRSSLLKRPLSSLIDK